MNIMKDREIDAFTTPWVNTHVAYLLAVHWATATIEEDNAGVSDPNNYDNIITTKEAETLDAFSSQVIHAMMNTAPWGGRD